MDVACLMSDGGARIAQIPITLNAVVTRPRSERILHPDAATMATSEGASVCHHSLFHESRIESHRFGLHGWDSRTRTMVQHEFAGMNVF